MYTVWLPGVLRVDRGLLARRMCIWPADLPEAERAIGGARLFLETRSVQGCRAPVRMRGGNPSHGRRMPGDVEWEGQVRARLKPPERPSGKAA